MANNASAMQVGHLPSLTWHKLKMNSTVVAQAPFADTDVRTSFRGLPAQITHRKLSAQAAAKWLTQHAPAEDPEKFVAGKIPIYHPQKFGTGLGKEYDDFIAASGVKTDLLEVKDGFEAQTPLLWQTRFDNGVKAAAAQILHVGADAKVTVIMDYDSDHLAQGTAAVSTKVVLEKNAQLTLVKAQTLGHGFLHLDDMGTTMADGAVLNLIQLELGAHDSYTGIQVEQVGDKAVLNGKVGYLAMGDESVDINYNVIQRGKKTDSLITFDGVLTDTAEKSWRGTIDFRNGSSGSKGDEQEDVLLLDPDVQNKSLPVILCEEEDVEGRHGASIGTLDDDMLFYMAARGIDKKTAERIMVRARLSAIYRDIPDEAVVERLHDFVEEAFKDESLS